MNIRLKRLITSVLAVASIASINAQTTTTYSFTGSPQSWTVPSCVSSITVTVAGADGGGSAGGNGATVTATIPVNPGDVITMNAGGTGVAGGVGYGGGGTGVLSNNGVSGYASYGGGGASTLSVNGTTVIIAAGGGGTGGGSNNVAGGGGGCATGITGASTFGLGGGGGTQVSGGNGGVPWAATPPGGFPGSLGQGGNGGPWDTASGGGGGGGYYGGGGGGNDGCCTGANGGGGGGGGSSLVPAGAGCTSASNNGSGFITITAAPGISASNTGPYCEGSTIQLNATAGATSYSWTGPNGFTSNVQNPTIPNATVANAGVYSVIGTGVGCTDPATTTVVVQAPPTPNAGPDDVVCLGDFILLNGTWSAPGNAHSWSHNAAGIVPAPVISYNPNNTLEDPAVMVNQPGTYTFILTENDGLCPPVTDQVSILVSNTTHTTSWVGPSCEGMSDGSITINNVDAVSYSYDGGTTWVPNSTQGGFPVGTYTVLSRNQYDCEFSSTVVITEPAPILISAGNDTLVCQNGTANLWASISVQGLNEVYHWSHDPGMLNTSTISPLVNTNILVYAEAANGCFSDTAYIQVDVRDPLSGMITGYDTICPGYPTTIGVFGLQGGIGTPYDIVWNSGEAGMGNAMNITANPPSTFMYTATITDACESTPLILNTEVYVAPLPEPMMSVVDGTLCEPAVFEVSNITDPNMNTSYYWVLSDGQMYANESPFFTEEMYEGSYDVQLVVTSPLGCIDSVTNEDFLIVYPEPTAQFTWSPNPVMMFNTDVQFSNQSFLDAYHQWFMPGGIPSSSNLERPETQYPDGVTGNYDVTLIVTSEEGCTDTITKTVIVYPEVLIFAPTAFTPDGDEFNQTWKPIISGIDVYSYTLEIYNRWGEMVWESHDLSVGWDGTYNGKVAEFGTYVWKISARDELNDGKYEWEGHLNILR